jgi:hypothetical protein
MSLATRLSAVVPALSSRGGCITCQWRSTLPDADQKAFDNWIKSNRSITQLWEITSTDPSNPIPVGVSALRLHARNCLKSDES